MNKQKFLRKIRHELRTLKKEERDKYIEYYDKIISDMVESGVSEEVAIERQGSAEQLAREILANTREEDICIKDIKGIALVVGSLCLLILCITPLVLLLGIRKSVSYSIGIIGGADGPTSIFLAGTSRNDWGLYAVTAVVLLVTILYFIKKWKKKK